MPSILPKSKAKGVDICGGNSGHYIIRGDLGCFMHSTAFHLGEVNTLYSLHSNCQGGEHYFSDTKYWYIIKGNKCRFLTDIENDIGAEVFDLDETFHGADHYLVSYGYFYTIFQEKGKYLRSSSLKTGSDVTEHDLSSSCKDGLYFWGTSSYFYFVVQDEWGVHYCATTDLSSDSRASIMPFHHDVMSFLPGGLAVSHGPVYGKWDLIEVISNDANAPVDWEMKIKWRVGYSKSKSTNIQHNWKVAATASCESGTLTNLIAKFQISLALEYGGLSLNTENESWEESTEKEETLKQKLEPGGKMYVWQYKLGFGKQDFLFCRPIRLQSDSTPPPDIPIPPSTQ